MLHDQFNISYDPHLHRLRCNGHVLNLAANAFLFNTADEALAAYNNPGILEAALPSEKELDAWRKKGPLGKLHNLVVHIQRTPQRRTKFSALSHGLGLVRDNSTRWNSWKSEIDRALKPQIKEAIQRYCDRYKENEEDRLFPEDWETLSKIKDILQAFEDATLSTEGRKSTLENVIPTMDFILDTLETACEAHQNDPFLGPCCNSSWAKMNEYYSKTEHIPVYIAAIVLHPGQKWSYFEENWSHHPEWITDAKDKVQKFWEASYKSKESAPRREPSVSSSDAPELRNTFRAWEKARKRARIPGDEYARYCAAEVVDDVADSRDWWQEQTQQLNYPNLSIMALDILSIPAMAAEPERLFSGAKISITDRRNRLGIEVIQALECLKSWLQLEATEWGESLLVGGWKFRDRTTEN